MNVQCPCCNNYTIDSDDEVIVEICEVCHWQYDHVAHGNPTKVIGPNKVSLNQARQNFLVFGACEERFVNRVRSATNDEKPRTLW
jgi:methionyl-tRNA synthetase